MLCLDRPQQLVDRRPGDLMLRLVTGETFQGTSKAYDGHGCILGRPMPDDLVIRLRGVVKRFGEITAVDGLDLDVP